MCGIAGVLSSRGAVAPALLGAMADALRHRGPDGGGVWHDAEAGIGLAHRRLAVVDLTPTGAQPMASADGRWWLVFNGEIYDHAELRASLEGRGARTWRGSSDTETLLAAIETWGVEGALSRCDGMFALALWDRRDRQLVLARDRLGERPLYVGWLGADIVFGSELAALRRHPDWRGGTDPGALASLLRFGFVPAPASIHPGIFKLPAASVLRLRAADAGGRWTAEEFAGRVDRWWRLEDVVENAMRDPWKGSEEDATAEFAERLDRSVARRMLADVPVGALLSGGIDSGLVVSSMQRQSSRAVRTFTVGFEESAVDESDAAAEVARLLGTDHSRILLPGRAALDLVEELPSIYDEPFADAAQLPAVLVSRAARRHVTVALTGDGGDELFHGYQRYQDDELAWTWHRRTPAFARRGVRALLGGIASTAPRGPLAIRARRFSGRIGEGGRLDHYLRRLSFPGFLRPRVEAANGGTLPLPRIPHALGESPGLLRFVDQAFALPEGIHAKLDHASMSCALELRVPLLAPEIVDFSWRLPMAHHARDGMGKHVLRRLFAARVSTAAASRPKHGFDVPVGEWLRGPLAPWADALLAAPSSREDPLLDAETVRARLADHASRRADYGHALWAALTYFAWRARHG